MGALTQKDFGLFACLRPDRRLIAKPSSDGSARQLVILDAEMSWLAGFIGFLAASVSFLIPRSPDSQSMLNVLSRSDGKHVRREKTHWYKTTAAPLAPDGKIGAQRKQSKDGRSWRQPTASS
jgi:hypothetical protein